jgi:hypothetical protein
MWITPKKLPGYPQKMGISFPHYPQNTACYVDKLWKIDEFLVELIAINSTFSSYPQFLGITYPHSKRRLWIKNGLFGKLSTRHTYTYIELRSFPQSYPHTRWGIFIIRTYPQKVGISFPHYPQNTACYVDSTKLSYDSLRLSTVVLQVIHKKWG